MSSFRWWRLAVSFVSGAALALAYPSFSVPLVGWAALGGLLLAVLGERPLHAAICGWMFGAGWYIFSLSWICVVLQQYGPMPLWMAAAVFSLMIVAMSLFEAAFAAAVAWIAGRSMNLALCAVPFLWTAMEIARMYLPQPRVNFAWNLLGYVAAGNLALVQLASLTGVYGFSFLVAAYGALLVWMFRAPLAPRRAAIWLAATAAILLVALIGPRFVPSAPATHVATLVQTELPQALDYPPNWDALHLADMAELDALSILPNYLPDGGAPPAAAVAPASAPASTDAPGLVVWPEVPAPFSLQQGDFRVRVARIAAESHDDFLFGEIDWKRPASAAIATPYNSAALFDPQGRELFTYDKIHLVPFGEFIPWRDQLFFARGLTGLVGDFGVGSQYAVGDLPGGRFGVFICYEAIFPASVRRFVANGAELLVNISNDGWFGRSAAPAQHLAQARVRAVENRRWLLRDTNNGYTVSVDPYGRIVARLPVGVRGRLAAPYAFRSDLTLYTRWGDWVPWSCVAISACFLVAAAFGRPHRPSVARRPAPTAPPPVAPPTAADAPPGPSRSVGAQPAPAGTVPRRRK